MLSLFATLHAQAQKVNKTRMPYKLSYVREKKKNSKLLKKYYSEFQ